MLITRLQGQIGIIVGGGLLASFGAAPRKQCHPPADYIYIQCPIPRIFRGKIRNTKDTWIEACSWSVDSRWPQPAGLFGGEQLMTASAFNGTASLISTYHALLDPL